MGKRKKFEANAEQRPAKRTKDITLTLELQNAWVFRLTTNMENTDFEDMDGNLKIHALMVDGGSEIHDEMDLNETDSWEFKNKLEEFWPSLQDGMTSRQFWLKEYNKHGRKIMIPRDYFLCCLDLREKIEQSLNLRVNVLIKISEFYDHIKERLGVDVELRLIQVESVVNKRFGGNRKLNSTGFKKNYLLWSIRVRVDAVTKEYEQWEKGVYNHYGSMRIGNLNQDMFVPEGNIKGIIASILNTWLLLTLKEI